MSTDRKVLVNGCSFTQWSDSWPNHLTNVSVTNLACKGAGMDYIHDSTVSEISKREYDFVAIMWSGLWRYDINVSEISTVEGSYYTSNYQKKFSSTPELIEDNWVFGCGHKDEDDLIVKSKLFDRIYAYTDIKNWVTRSLIKMISLQNTLNENNIPYLFMYYNNYEHLLTSEPSLYKMLDTARVYNAKNIDSIAKKNNWLDEDGIHPGPEAHKYWAQLIQPFITQ